MAWSLRLTILAQDESFVSCEGCLVSCEGCSESLEVLAALLEPILPRIDCMPGSLLRGPDDAVWLSLPGSVCAFLVDAGEGR